eukprot:scaffold13700_cov252-Ochromonas_danica.AAC.10
MIILAAAGCAVRCCYRPPSDCGMSVLVFEWKHARGGTWAPHDGTAGYYYQPLPMLAHLCHRNE